MLKQFTFLLIGLCGMIATANAQTPRTILSDGQNGQTNLLACPPGQQNFAGTVSLGAINAQSNDVDLDTMYLCLGDEVEIIHNGDAVLDGDPNQSTPAGIGYAFYDCLPTISGPDKVTIGADPCLVDNPPPLDLFYVATEGNLNGDILFFNDGNLIDVFNGGAPQLYWWTPITFDSLSVTMIGPNTIYQAVYENNGLCVHANIDAAIPVVYLTGIDAANIQTGAGSGQCQGSFDLTGGLPEWDNSNYDITIELAADPTVIGAVTSGPATHGDNVSISVPQPGLYNVTVEDGKSCGLTFQIDMPACNAISMSMPSISTFAGQNVCLAVTVENFNNIDGLQFSIVYDDAILDFTNTQAYNPSITNLSGGNFFNVGNAVNFVWTTATLNGNSLPDGAVMFEICFDVIGQIGECSPVQFSSDPVAIEVVQNGTGLIGFFGTDGQVCISANELTVDLMIEDVSCPGANDGTFTATVNDGTPPYSLTWQNITGGPVQGPGLINTQGGSFTGTNLPPGSYAVSITDNGPANDFLDTIVINQGPALNVIFNQTPALCNGGTGSITAIIVIDSVIIQNPGPQYEFMWSNNGMTQTISGVASGLYSVTITDNTNGCMTNGSTFLPQTPAINATVSSQTDATCSGLSDGALTVTVSGGTPDAMGNYEIFWPTVGGGVTDFGTTSTVSNLASATYPVIVTDGNGCIDTTQIDLGNVKDLTITATTFTEISCNGVCDGSISVEAATVGGVSNAYVFTWIGVPAIPPPGPVNTLTTSTVNNLCAGNYTIILTDDQGCQTDTAYQLTQPPLLDATLLASTDETCAVGNDGTATAAVTGGVFPYAYDWGVAGQVDSTATGLSAGSYTLTVTDANGCQDSVMAVIDIPTPPAIVQLDNDTLACAGDNNGSLTVVAVPGGSPIANYSWTGGQSGPAVTTINGLSPGLYFVTVTGADACVAIDSAVVVAPAPLVLDNFQTTSPLCPGDGGGSVSVFVSGGTGPYFYDWTLDAFDGIGISAIGGANVVAGNYSVTITDANDCPSLTVDVLVEDPPSIVVDFTAIDSVSCFQNQGVPCDGTATASAMYSDGTAGVFNFIWPSGESEFSVMNSTASQLCQGNQMLIVSDGTCTVNASVFIPFPDTLRLGNQVEIDDVTCFGFADGSATVSALGGTAPYNFQWSNLQTGATASNLAPGNYGVTITDSKGCQFQTTIPIDEPDPLVAFLDQFNTIDTVTCNGDSDGVLTVTAQGGNLNISPTLTYNWAGGVAPSNSNMAVGLLPGTYTVTVSDILGCSDVLTATIYEPPAIFFQLAPIAEIPCADSSTVITVDTAYGGNGTANLFFSFSVDNASPQPLGTQIPVGGGSHLIQIFDQSGCAKDTTINLPEPPPIVLEYPETVIVELGDSTVLEPDLLISQFPILDDSILWTPTIYLRFENNLLEPVVRPLESQLYTVIAYDANGCPATDQIFVEVDKNRNVYIPNIFTPNNDGSNDFFQVFTGNGVAGIRSLRVFDRWGELMFSQQNLPPTPDLNPAYGWDGTLRGKKLNAGVFVYLVEVEFEDGEVLLYRGDVTLIR